MNAITENRRDLHHHAAEWLEKFNSALSTLDQTALAALFTQDAQWRDMLALTWNITPHHDLSEILADLTLCQPKMQARDFRIADGRTPVRHVRRTGQDVIEALFTFETNIARCEGVLRLPLNGADQACVFATSMRELKGHEEPIYDRRPSGETYSRNFGGANWSDLRKEEQAFSDHDPYVLIVGASQFGVTLAARLRLLGVDALVVERTPRVGDQWRNRYHALALHNQLGKNHFPYIPFPASWPKYLSKDMVGGFIEFYAWAMEANIWTSTTFTGATYDDNAELWSANVTLSDGSTRVLKPAQLVFANGFLGGKKWPNVAGLDDFAGEILHTEDYKRGEAWKGKRAIVLGSGTSGHDCAQDLHGAGASVGLIQRGSTTVTSVEAASMSDALFLQENLPLADADLISIAATFPMVKKAFQLNTLRMNEYDAALHAGLRARGFKLDDGPDEAGFQMKLRTSHGGYYLNCGCSDLIVSGDIELIQWDDADRFVPEGLRMKDGSIKPADLLVTATGYYTQEEVVRQLLGDDIADRVGQTWGTGENGELRNMFCPTAQKGLWFAGGGLQHNRVYSHYLALQLKGRALGLVQ